MDAEVTIVSNSIITDTESVIWKTNYIYLNAASRQHDIDEEARIGDELPTTSRQGEAQSIRLQEYEGHNKKTYKSEEYNDLVFVMLQFALELMRTMKSFNVENLQCEADEEGCGTLRIGNEMWLCFQKQNYVRPKFIYLFTATRHLQWSRYGWCGGFL